MSEVVCLFKVLVFWFCDLLWSGCHLVAKLCPTLWPHGLQHARLLCLPLSPGVCANSCPLCQWCHPTVSPSVSSPPPALNLSQHQGLFHCVRSSHQVVLELQPQHQFFQWIFRVDSFRIDWFDLLTVQGTLKSLLCDLGTTLNYVKLSCLIC